MSDQVKFTPTITEYNGIVFRSKSEAIFARAMDMTGHMTWAYEPRTIDGYTVDFVVDLICPDAASLTARILVEYKPSQPTETYCEKLEQIDQSDYDGFILFYGSPYEPDKDIGFYSICQSAKSRHSKMERMGFMGAFVVPVANNLVEAKNYRFDLRHDQ